MKKPVQRANEMAVFAKVKSTLLIILIQDTVLEHKLDFMENIVVKFYISTIDLGNTGSLRLLGFF